MDGFRKNKYIILYATLERNFVHNMAHANDTHGEPPQGGTVRFPFVPHGIPSCCHLADDFDGAVQPDHSPNPSAGLVPPPSEVLRGMLNDDNARCVSRKP